MGDSVWATYSEAGVLWGRTSEDKTIAAGHWYEAGQRAVCNSGTWQAVIDQSTPDTLEMVFFCSENENSPVAFRNETRLNDSTNDDDCHVVKGQATFPGTWGNKLLGVEKLVACEDGNRAYASIITEQERLVYVVGTSYEDGRIFTGQYFAEFGGAKRTGPYMFFPISRTSAVQIFWSGGFIDIEEINDPTLHRVESGIQYRNDETSGCQDNDFLIDEIDSANMFAPAVLLIVCMTLLFL